MAPSINLIPASRRLALERRRRIHAWVATVAVYAGVVGAGCVWSLATLVERGADEHRRLDDAEARVEQLESDRLAKQRELTEAAATLRANLVVTLEPDWSVLMALVARALGDDAVLTSFRLMPSDSDDPSSAGTGRGLSTPYVLLLSGRSRSQGGVSGFVLALEDLGLFEHVTLVESRREPTSERELIAFDLRCDIASEEEDSP